MTTLPIKIFPDPILRETTAEVTSFDKQLSTFVDSMIETMYDSRGIGLAAPQVGMSKRICVVDVSEEGNNPLRFINPIIVSKSGSTPSEEGCLSIPGYRETIKRSKEILVNAFDLEGKPFELAADGLLAICLQHEIDHLNGILFIDHLSRLKRQMFKKWLSKQDEEREAE